jgi:predicted RNA-binding Zn-ribbon protein involved in translation (DUF1610 family)
MPTYKHPCPHCGQYIQGDAQFCPFCGVQDPFTSSNEECPSCGREIESTEMIRCPSCGFFLNCPACEARVSGDGYTCESCGIPLRCPGCGESAQKNEKVCWFCGQQIRCNECDAVVQRGSLNECSECDTELESVEPSPREQGIPRKKPE